MHHSISIPAAAELCGVGEPAIRRALREYRIKLAFQWCVGGGDTITYLNLESVLLCYGVEDRNDECRNRIREWAEYAPVVRTADGRKWLVLDRKPTMILLEPAE